MVDNAGLTPDAIALGTVPLRPIIGQCRESAKQNQTTRDAANHAHSPGGPFAAF
jgi:hypothetical protein